MKIFNSLVLLVVALFAFGCSTAVVDAEGDDATVGVDAQSADTDTTNNADAADAQTGTDSDTQSNADATQPKPDTTTSADAHKVDSGADSQNTTPDAHHSAPDAAGDTKDVGNDTGSNADAAKNDVDAANNGSTDASSIDANKPDSSVDSGADANSADADKTNMQCTSSEDCNQGLSCTKYVCITSSYPSQGSFCSVAKFTEICDGIDNDCDGITDNAKPELMQTYYEDKDGDAFGNPNSTIKACSKPVGYVVSGTDCGDTDTLIRPGALERCNNLDDNCNGQIDENVKLVTYYADQDNDGYGSSANPTYPPTTLCDNGYQAIPSYYVSNKDDCNDKATSAHPGATEVCGDNLDNNCDGQSDENCQVCDAVACGNLGGSCVANVCKTFCDSCGQYSACEDTNKDGLGDTCTAIPSALIQPYYKDLDNAIVTVLPGLPMITNFYGIYFRTFKTLAEKNAGWFNYPQWTLQSNFYVMELYDGLPANAAQSAKSSGFNDPDVCGIRFNADISTTGGTSPVNHWLCEGNGATAHVIDPGARFFRVKNTVLIEITKFVKPWSAPGSTSADGCAMMLETQATCPQN